MHDLMSSQHYSCFMVIFSPRLGIIFSNWVKSNLSICDFNQTWDSSYISLLDYNESYESCIGYICHLVRSRA